MMSTNNCFLSGLIQYKNTLDWDTYYDEIYQVFVNDFLIKELTYNGKKVQIKKYPLVGKKEQSFFHITTIDDKNGDVRIPDFRRCERIKWVREFIEHYFCNKECHNCLGIHNWIQPFKNRFRTYICNKSKKFLVVLEERSNYYLLITAFYINEKNTKKIYELEKNYNMYKKTEKSSLIFKN